MLNEYCYKNIYYLISENHKYYTTKLNKLKHIYIVVFLE